MEIKIPQNCTVTIEPTQIKVKFGSEEHSVNFNSKKLKAELKDGSIIIDTKKKERRETYAMANAVGKHLKNILAGNITPYQKKMQVIYAHFPISVEIKSGKVIIKNFLGEKVPRVANIVGKTAVTISGQELTIKGNNIEHVGQTAANIIQSVRIVGKDRRVFQDGIYHIK